MARVALLAGLSLAGPADLIAWTMGTAHAKEAPQALLHEPPLFLCSTG